MSRREFDLCAEPILQYVPSLQVLQWAPRVELAHRESFEQSARRQGWADYRIVEPNARGQLVPAGHRDVSFPIWYAATRSGFQARFGWDFMADPALREAIERCRDTNQFVVSRQIDLSQSGLPSRVLQTFLPVYRDHEHTKSIADRRKNLEGLLVGLCEVDDLIDGALRYASGPQGLDVAIFDLASGDSPELLYFHVSRTRDGDIRSATATPNPPGLHFDGSLQFGGRPWQLVCTPAPKFFAAHASWRSWTALVVGLIVTGSVANRAWTWMTRTQRVERLVTERTLDLRKKDDQLRQVQENKARAIRHAHEETIQRLMAASLCRDEETGQHIRRTGLLSEMLARAAGWSDADAELIRLAAPMHDIGKIGIPDAILRKPDKLTPAEYETMKMHTLLGARMLEGSQSAILALAHDIALAHHERWVSVHFV